MTRYVMKQCIVLTVSIFISITVCSQTYTKADVYSAWEQGDLNKLVAVHSKNPSLRSLTEEAIGQINVESTSLSFEDLLSFTEQLGQNSPLYRLFINALKDKKAQILKQVAQYTPEELNAYIRQHPTQGKFIKEEMDIAIGNSISVIPLNELYYVERTMPYLNREQITQEAKGRDAERKDILQKNLADYMKKEKAELSYLEYVLRQKEHEYFRNKYRNVCAHYARSKQVSPYIYEMESQYKQIVRYHFNPSDIQLYLQKEADAICNTINSSRSEYCRAMGKSDFVKLSVTVPAPNYECNSSTSGFEKVLKAYEDYNSSRESISTVGSIARFLGAGFWASIGEGIAEWAAGSSLADNITSAQLEYVGDYYRALENKVVQQIDEAHKSILKQISTNQEKFMKDATR